MEATSPISVDEADAEAIRGKRVLAVEDGPTLTHGEMSFGAGILAARKFGASEIIDPRPYAVGSIRERFSATRRRGQCSPHWVMAQSKSRNSKRPINAAPVDLVLIATPIDLRRIVKIKHPTVRVRYELKEIGQSDIGGYSQREIGELTWHVSHLGQVKIADVNVTAVQTQCCIDWSFHQV